MRTWLSGRALASQAEDREFESRRPLHQQNQGLLVFHARKTEVLFVLSKALNVVSQTRQF